MTAEEAKAAVAVLQCAINLAWAEDLKIASLDVVQEVVPCQLVAALSGLQQTIAERFIDAVDEDSEGDLEG